MNYDDREERAKVINNLSANKLILAQEMPKIGSILQTYSKR